MVSLRPPTAAPPPRDVGEVKPLETYGLPIPAALLPQVKQLNIELECFRTARTVEQGGVGKAEHFWRAVAILWPKHSTKPFDRHPTAEKIIALKCRYPDVALSGHTSSAKSDVMAAYALVTWLADPDNALVIVMSTDIKSAKGRIWGHIRNRYDALPAVLEPLDIEVPGRTYEDCRIKREQESDTAGIYLYAGDQTRAAASTNKIIGLVCSGTLLCVFDEATGLAPALFGAYFDNLAGKGTSAEFAALANFADYLDPFGRLITPIDGWESVNPDTTEEWPATQVRVLRLDGLQSPNWLAGQDVYPYLIKHAFIKKFYDRGLENTPGFWRMVRSWPAPSGMAKDKIYDPSEVTLRMHPRAPVFEGEVRVFAGLDPAFTEDGCAAAFVAMKIGFDAEGRLCIWPFVVEKLEVRGDTPADGISFQVVRQFKARCEQLGIDPRDSASDATSEAFMHIMRKEFSVHVHATRFQGGASDRTTSDVHPVPNNQRFGNRVSELWGVGLDFLRAGCFYAFPPKLVEEMCLRQWANEKSVVSGLKRKVERKADMKHRTARSVDFADAAFIALDVALERMHIRPQQGEAKAPGYMDKRMKRLRAMRALQQPYGMSARGLAARMPNGITMLRDR